jgi:hypothetical protein
MRLLDLFDRIYVINLPERSDRRREMLCELERIGLGDDPRLSFFTAIRPAQPGTFTSVGARGVYESQKAILAEAASTQTSVLILEDDCSFAPEAATYRTGAEWDIFYGGYDASDPSHLHRSDIVGAHMMGFSRTGAQLVSTYLEQLTCDGIHPPIDAAYVWYRRAYPNTKTHFAVPPLAHQRSSRSDISPRLHDRLPFVRDVASIIRRSFKR